MNPIIIITIYRFVSVSNIGNGPILMHAIPEKKRLKVKKNFFENLF